MEIVKDIQEETRQILKLLGSGDAGEPLRRIVQMRAQLDGLTAGLVGRARHHRLTWSRIGHLLSISEDTARHRYTDAYILRRLGQLIPLRPDPTSLGTLYGQTSRAAEGSTPPTPEEDPPPQPRTPNRAAYNRLAPVLSMLARASQMSIQDLSSRSGCSASYLSRILSGERVPSWRLTERFAHACGADAGVLRKVWETERLRDKTPRAVSEDISSGYVPNGTPQGGFERLLTALRTLHIRAGQPTAYDIAVATKWRLTPNKITAILDGTHLPSWEELLSLLHVLGGPCEYFRPLWKAAADQSAAPSPKPDLRSQPSPSLGSKSRDTTTGKQELGGALTNRLHKRRPQHERFRVRLAERGLISSPWKSSLHGTTPSHPPAPPDIV
ncbi:hypothetical protein GCM10010420_10790 [Streptomyces glaucosporus]|uniref:HTH cro/C1-type domain-containing protein n=1 Tax=Streptomyces glaucosporus TaxID=284044 RepID=A0ABN3HVW9_9ACTN